MKPYGTYRNKDIGFGTACLAILVLLAFGLGFTTVVVYFGWNLVVPSLFNGPAIEWSHAFGVALLLTVVRSAISGIITFKK